MSVIAGGFAPSLNAERGMPMLRKDADCGTLGLPITVIRLIVVGVGLLPIGGSALAARRRIDAISGAAVGRIDIALVVAIGSLRLLGWRYLLRRQVHRISGSLRRPFAACYIGLPRAARIA